MSQREYFNEKLISKCAWKMERRLQAVDLPHQIDER